MSAPDDGEVELPTPYSKPVEAIREEEYPHMKQGKLDYPLSSLPLSQPFYENQPN